MSANDWKFKQISVASLYLDPENPRLDTVPRGASPRELIQMLFTHNKAIEVAESIALRGFFPNEPLLAIHEDNKYIVVEGNRRLAALKALREPSLLDDANARRVDRFARRIGNINSISKVPVIIAPDRRSTDRQIAGKHVGTPVLAWQSESRANFILRKIEEGYDNQELNDELGFTEADIRAARRTKAIADITWGLDLPEEVVTRLNHPRTKILTTLERVVDSTVGRSYLHVQPDPEHGIKGVTSQQEFLKGFKKLVTDVATGSHSSRTLNSNEDIKRYFESWSAKDRPKKRSDGFIPGDLVGKTSSALTTASPKKSEGKPKQACIHATVLPKTLKAKFANAKMIHIRNELIKLKRDDFPNAGAVLLRVFFEITVRHYLERIGALERITQELRERKALQFDSPQMKQLIPEIIKITKEKLPKSVSSTVEKAIKYDASAPFTYSEFNAFVHSSLDLPTGNDIFQFWNRTEPIFRLMLEADEAIGRGNEN